MAQLCSTPQLPPLGSSFDSRIDPEQETWSTKFRAEPQQGGHASVGVLASSINYLAPQDRRCLAQHPRGGGTTKRGGGTKRKPAIPSRPFTAKDTYYANTQSHCTYRTCLNHPPTTWLTRAAQAHPLRPAALAFVSYGIVLV